MMIVKRRDRSGVLLGRGGVERRAPSAEAAPDAGGAS